MSYARYIDGSRVVYWDDSTGNLTVPGTLTASNIEGASFSLGPSIQVSSIDCSSINAGSIQNGTNTAYANYTDTTVPASDGILNGVNLTAINQRVHPSLGEQLLFTNSAWTTRTPAANRNWRKIAWSPLLKLYCAVSDNGLSVNNIMTSPDGITWTSRTLPLALNLGAVIWVDSLGKFIAVGSVGSSAYSVTSTDGITWIANPMSDTAWFLDLVWAPQLKRMVAVSWTFPNGKTIAYSSDGIIWTQIFPNLPTLTSRWAGITWSPEKGLFVAVSAWEDLGVGAGKQIMTSPDGITWTVRTHPGAGKQWYAVAWSPELGLFAAVARSADSQCIMTSGDGINWTLRTSPPHFFTYIVWSQELSMFIVTNDGSSPSVTVSRDGVTWTAYTVLPAARAYYGMVWSREQSKLIVLDNSTNAPGSYIVTSEPAFPASQNTLLFASPGYASINNSNGLISMSSMNISSALIGSIIVDNGNISTINTNNVSTAILATNTLNTNTLSAAIANISTVNVNTVIVNTINVVSTSIGIMGALSTNTISSAIVATSTLNTNTISSGLISVNSISLNNDRIILGNGAGATNPGTHVVAIGASAGNTNQGSNAIAIGFGAGETNQIANSIILNASNTSLNATTNSGFYVNPVRIANAPNTVYYNSTTKELTFGATPNTGIGDSLTLSSVTTSSITLYDSSGGSGNIQFSTTTITTDYNFTPRDVNRGWVDVASSADGTKLVAVEVLGFIYTSTDSGLTWTARTNISRNWSSVASSSDGTKLVAAELGGQLYTSTDSGITWTARESNRAWKAVASSADGTKLVAVVTNGYIYTSTDSGVSWTQRATDTTRNWTCVASSADGTKLIAAVQFNQIFISNNSGLTWTGYESFTNWIDVAISTDGSKLVAVDYGGSIYTSIDNGVTWTPREAARNWRCVASSADGTILIAGVTNGQLYVSINGGTSWSVKDSNRDWRSVAISSDGKKVVAVVGNGQIYTNIIEGGGNIVIDSYVSITNMQNTVTSTVVYYNTLTKELTYGAVSGSGSIGNAITVSSITTSSILLTDTLSIGEINYKSTDLGWIGGIDLNASWGAGTISSDGSTFIVPRTAGQLYISIDNGISWNTYETNRNWSSVASSSNGLKLVALVNNGYIYTSVDRGLTWTARMTDANRYWVSVASSADGTSLVAIENDGTNSGLNGKIYTSTDSGVTWTQRAGIDGWIKVISSSDGNTLFAILFTMFAGSLALYRSTDSGVTWGMVGSLKNWRDIAVSADGNFIVGAADVLYVSRDRGSTWTTLYSLNRDWNSISVSANGTKIVATGTLTQTYVYTSINAGSSWTESLTYPGISIRMSGDGAKLLGYVNIGKVYTYLIIGKIIINPSISASSIQLSSISSGTASIGVLNVSTISGFSPIQVRDAIIATSTLYASSFSASTMSVNMINSPTSNVVHYNTITKELTYGSVSGLAISTFNSFSTGTASIGSLNVSSIGGFSPIQVRDAIIATSTIYADSMTTGTFITSSIKASSIMNVSAVLGVVRTISDISLEWIKQLPYMNTTQYDNYSNIAVDGFGNIYICYYTQYGTVSGGTAMGGYDIVVSKLNNNGEIQWVKESRVFNTIGDEYNPFITIDTSGNIYVSYVTNNTVSGGTLLGATDIVIIKFDTNGNILSLSQSPKINSISYEYVPIITSDIYGNVYLLYSSSGTVSGGTNLGGSDIVIVKLNNNGNVQWIVQPSILNTINLENSGGIKVDNNGNVYITYSSELSVSGGVASGTQNIVVVKLDTNGAVIWIRETANMNTSGENIYPDIAIDSSGNVYVTYRTTGTVSGGTNYGSSQDIVVFKLNNDGVLQWIKQSNIFNTQFNDTTPRIAIGPSQNIYIVYSGIGTVSGGVSNQWNDIIMFALDTNGNILFTKQQPVMNTSTYDYYPSIVIDSNEIIYVSYYTEGTISGGQNNGVAGSADIIVMKFIPNILYNPVNIPLINTPGITANTLSVSSITMNDSITSSLIGYNSVLPTSWVVRDSVRVWTGITSSEDGTKLVAVEYSGSIYISVNSGTTWTPVAGLIRKWSSVASSADGRVIVAVEQDGGQIYRSSDSGTSWAVTGAIGNWRSVASSADGTKLIAAEYGGFIYTSVNTGASWIQRTQSFNWTGVASSADGTKLVATVDGGRIYTSTDSGINWTPRDSNRNWRSIASSADGTKLVATVSVGYIYTSNDSGVTWTPRESPRSWYTVTSSADGMTLAAIDVLGSIYISKDGGVNWTSYESNREWSGITVSGDGLTFAAIVSNGYIYTASISGVATINSFLSITNMLNTATQSTNLVVYNTTTKQLQYNTAKTFVIDHPTNPSRYLVHACLEGPESGVYYRGKSCIPNNSSSVVVCIPEYATSFGDFTIQVTPVWNGVPRLLNVSEMSADGTFTVYGEPGEFNWHVHGKRGDIDVEPYKSSTIVSGSGPYKWIM